MATRFYPSTRTLTRPTIRAAWTTSASAEASARIMYPSGSGSWPAKTDPAYSQAISKTVSTNPWMCLRHVLVTPRFAQEFAITAGCSISVGRAGMESSTSLNAYQTFHVYTLNTDGTVGATLNSTTLVNCGSEYTTSLLGRVTGSVALSDGVTVSVGQRIVVELGERCATTGTSYNNTTNLLGAQGADITSGGSSAADAWVEFSDTFDTYLEYDNGGLDTLTFSDSVQVDYPGAPRNVTATDTLTFSDSASGNTGVISYIGCTNYYGGGATISVDRAVTAGNLLLLVRATMEGTTAHPTPTTSGLTWYAVGSQAQYSGGGSGRCSMWYAIASTTTTINVAGGSANSYNGCCLAEFSGVDTADPIDVTNQIAQRTDPSTVTLAGVVANSAVFCGLSTGENPSAITGTDGTTVIWDESAGAYGVECAVYRITTTAGTYTPGVDFATSLGYGTVACSLNFAGGSAPATLTASATDTLTFSDSATVLLDCSVSASDTLTFSDSATAELQGPRVVTATDTLTLSESVAVQPSRTAQVSDTLTLSDSASGKVQDCSVVSTDTLTLSDVSDAFGYVGKGTTTDTALKDITLALPSGLASGDFMTAIVLKVTSSHASGPEGWTELGHQDYGAGNLYWSLWYKTAQDDEPTPTWGFPESGSAGFGYISAWRGVDPTTPIHDTDFPSYEVVDTIARMGSVDTDQARLGLIYTAYAYIGSYPLSTPLAPDNPPWVEDNDDGGTASTGCHGSAGHVLWNDQGTTPTVDVRFDSTGATKYKGGGLFAVHVNAVAGASVQVQDCSVSATDTLTLSDAVGGKVQDCSVSATDTLTFSDSHAETRVDAFTDLTVTASDTLTLSDSTSRKVGDCNASSTDTLTFSDVVAGKVQDCSVAASNTLTFSDSVSGKVGDCAVVTTNTLTFSDSVSGKVGDCSVTASDTLTLSDSHTESVSSAPTTLTIPATDTLTFSDSVGVRLSHLQAISSDTLTFSDSATAMSSLAVNKADRFVLFDGPAFLSDSYPSSNYSYWSSLDNLTYQAHGQSFTAGEGVVDKASFWMRKFGSPTGAMYAKVYNLTGTHGTNATPTGSPIAVSASRDASALNAISFEMFEFDFDNTVSLTPGQNYFVTVEYALGTVSHYVMVGYDATSPSHAGNGVTQAYGSGSWVVAAVDYIFELYQASAYPPIISLQVSSPEIAKTDTITFSDSRSVVTEGQRLSVADSLTISDSVKLARNPEFLILVDTLTFSDSVGVTVPILISAEKLSREGSLRRPTVSGSIRSMLGRAGSLRRRGIG